jgi:CheY-like chemotaxis protein
VLLVDDYPDALETWRVYLELSGFEVVTAADGRTAVEKALSSHPHVIVMDLELPVLSGFEATRQLRAMDETARIPVIAATGYSHFNGLDQARLAPFDLVVVKPCDPSQLLAQIRRLLDRTTTSNGNGHHAAQNG